MIALGIILLVIAMVNLSVESEGNDSFFIQRTRNPFDDNDYYFNKCEDNELAFGQFLKMIK